MSRKRVDPVAETVEYVDTSDQRGDTMPMRERASGGFEESSVSVGAALTNWSRVRSRARPRVDIEKRSTGK